MSQRAWSPGAVDPPPVPLAVHEPPRRQLGVVQVAAGQTAARQAQFADLAGRHVAQVVVEDERFGVGDRHPDRCRVVLAVRGHDPAGCVDRRLRRPVIVHEGVGQVGGRERVQLLAGAEQVVQPQRLRLRGAHYLRDQRCRRVGVG